MPTALRPIGPHIKLRDLRRAHSLTLEQLAERIAEQGVDVTVAGLSNVENGNKVASDRLLTAWAKAFGLNPLDVFAGELREPVEPAKVGRRSA